MAANNPVLQNSAMTSIVTPMGHIIDEFLNRVEEFDSKLAYVYDENLSYETGLAKWRMDNEIDTTNEMELPLFIFRRSVLRPEDEKGIGARSKQFSGTVMNSDKSKVKKFKAYFGAFDIDFLFVTRSMLDLERFELSYLMQSGLSKNKTMMVNFPEIGDVDYNMEYGLLDEKTINIDNSYYKLVSGTFVIRGLFFAFTEESNYIKTVKSKIRDYVVGTCPPEPTELLGKITVTETTTILE